MDTAKFDRIKSRKIMIVPGQVQELISNEDFEDIENTFDEVEVIDPDSMGEWVAYKSHMKNRARENGWILFTIVPIENQGLQIIAIA